MGLAESDRQLAEKVSECKCPLCIIALADIIKTHLAPERQAAESANRGLAVALAAKEESRQRTDALAVEWGMEVGRLQVENEGLKKALRELRNAVRVVDHLADHGD